MYILHTGIIGETVRQKISSQRDSIISGKPSSGESFRDVMLSLLETTSSKQKVVGISNLTSDADPVKRADGSAMMYAIMNADTDTTASAIVSSMGISGTENSLKNDADSLTESIRLLTAMNGMSDESVFPQLSDFTAKYNALLTELRTNTTASGFMYASLLKTAAQNASSALAAAGIAVDEDGRLSLDTSRFESVGLEGFLTTLASAVSAVSTYSSSIRNNDTDILGFLTGDESSEGNSYLSASNYYNSLMDFLS